MQVSHVWAGDRRIAVAKRPDLVRRPVFFGTYASAAEAFTRPDLGATLLALVRSHWGLGSKLLADLYRPDPADAAADHLAAVLRDSADRDVAAGLPDARLVTLEGRYHLPDIRDLDHIAGTITAFLSGPP